MRGPLLVAEPVVGGASRQDEVVVGELAGILDCDHVAGRIDALTSPMITLVARRAGNRAHRARNVRWGERGGRNLIKQRLKHMVVGAVDEQNVDAAAGHPRAALMPPNPAPTIATRGRGRSAWTAIR